MINFKTKLSQQIGMDDIHAVTYINVLTVGIQYLSKTLKEKPHKAVNFKIKIDTMIRKVRYKFHIYRKQKMIRKGAALEIPIAAPFFIL